ncbi:MAG: Transcription elongation factor spt6 [Phylliscum demangeonii]|nr:MAG: Transcription elongation factor spt6 [Phylliscum demangeonii]
MLPGDLIQGEAELDNEDEVQLDEETGLPKGQRHPKGVGGGMAVSSDEEDEEDDEEALRVEGEGFIADDEDEEEPDGDEGETRDERQERRLREKKRRREARHIEENLDEDDLVLIGESHPEFVESPRFKRLKQNARDDTDRAISRGLEDIFSDEDGAEKDVDDVAGRYGRPRRDDRALLNEFDDFIEEDEMTDEEGQGERSELPKVARPRPTPYGLDTAMAAGLDQETIDLIEAAFGNGDDYDWSLALEEPPASDDNRKQKTELKDVFEHSQLVEKLLTKEDDRIRATDEPERFQLARAPFKDLVMTEDQMKEEALWIARMMPKRRLAEELMEPFRKAVAKVLEFFLVDDVEVPFVFQHRKDYLIHAAKVALTPDPNHPDAPQYIVNAEKLLNQNDLWQILDYDIKFRALVSKRNTLEATYGMLRQIASIDDPIFDQMLPAAETMEELQDLQDYLYFQYTSQLKDIKLTNGTATQRTQRRPGVHKSLFERVRNGKVYRLVRAFGITADAFAQNASKEGRRQYADDPNELPDNMADAVDLLDPPEFSTGALVLKAAKAMFAEEIAMNPKMRRVTRQAYYMSGIVDCVRTDRGLKLIDEQHQYYEFKYLRNQQLSDIARQPDMFLRMLEAELNGLVQVTIRLQNEAEFKKQLYNVLASDNFSEVADAWNAQRKEVLEMALARLHTIMAKGVMENLKTRCEDEIAALCRDEFSKKLDQAPFKPAGMSIGTIPRVLALSCGGGSVSNDAVCWAWVEEDGRVLENGKFMDLRTDEGAKQDFVELVQRRKPDVIGVAGFTVETRDLVLDLEKIIQDEDLRGAEYTDLETGDETSKKLDVVMVNDEVARLYHASERAAADFPRIPPLTRYCVALAKYLQNPMKEYASLGKDIVSVSFHPSQKLVPAEKILKQLESALVDMVNLCGVDINEAAADPYTASLLPFVCGLGPRKAIYVLRAVNFNGGYVPSRDELVGDQEGTKMQVVGPRVWNNCASFLYMDYDSSELSSEYLDNTRVHPEDYELGRKMAADALELDEEDIKAEIDDAGPGAVVRKLIKDEAQEKVNDLILEEYAEQLERNFNQKKRATLETIRAELQLPYEELRRNFALLSTDEIFTMLTGETRETLCQGMTVPVAIKRILNQERQLGVVLDCGVRSLVPEHEIFDWPNQEIPLNQRFAPHQMVQAKILSLSRSQFEASLSLREDVVRRPYRRQFDRMPDEWDEAQEERDKETLQEKSEQTERTQRVIKHPLFRPFNSAQAEEYLGSQSRGDAVIRPSSKGLDHIAITWKVSDNVYQHIDVLELDKDSEFSVGRTLKIGGRYIYSDLDELIVNHIKAMSRKVDEMTLHEKYQNGTKAETERWLTTYTEANPKRSVYVFCLNSKHPGYFHLCFKAGQRAQLSSWPVKVIPNAFEMRNNAYPDMRALCNGFKLMFSNMHGLKGL